MDRARSTAVLFTVLAVVFLLDAIKTHAWPAIGGVLIGAAGAIVMFARSRSRA